MKHPARQTTAFYRSNWFLWLFLIFFPPVGILLLWLFHKSWKPLSKGILSLIFVLWSLLLVSASNDRGSNATITSPTQIASNSPVITAVPAPTNTPIPTITPTPTVIPTPVPTPSPKETPEISTFQEIEPSSPSPLEAETPSPYVSSGGASNTYDISSQQNTSATYVLNTSTKKFHLPSCSSVKKISSSNYSTSSESKNTLISQGYSPCKKCNP